MPQPQSTAAYRYNGPVAHASSELGAMATDAEILRRQATEMVRGLVSPVYYGTGMNAVPGSAATANGLTALPRPEEQIERRTPSLQPPSSLPSRSATFCALQEWEGFVVRIGSTDFVARLVDLTGGSSHEEEEATIPLTEVAPNDTIKLQQGSIFRWVIGYERSVYGTRRRISQIVFRDLPVVTKAGRQESEVWARKALRSLGL